MKLKLTQFALSALMFLVYTFPTYAEDDLQNPPSDGDDLDAPIDQWILVLLFAAIVIGCKFYKNFKSAKLSNP